ncbi:glycosyltransferase family 2 protein [Brevundimonas sp.]|uniref:glycosyltransferase n=1 Tax=Brevundimonas sp. TaxID=1871086 RepID=UPI002ABCBAF5|nr:glycosyltransferase family 2 protein [Brevundimonas sp.]MDZ4362578.1 glycosyltransferase family 2 protein [Brevundimonas sp.]
MRIQDPVGDVTGSTPFCVCVPARNEAARLPILLEALGQQDIGGVVPVAIGLNNTTDGSMEAIEAAGLRWPGRLSIRIEAVTFEPALAHAGSARRHAMALGAEVVGNRRDAVLISTDADSRPPPCWIRANLAALEDGADVIGGRLEIDRDDDLTSAMAAARNLWDHYWSVVRSIEDGIDPVAWDLPPRHGDHTGASLAMRLETWRAAGGVPAVPVGEDRALVAAAVAIGARLRHPPSVWTRVSARTQGRADSGMATHMAAMARALDAGEAMMAPSFDQWRSRATWRRAQRLAGVDPADLAALEQGLPSMIRNMALSKPMEAA